uniref:Thioredoxin domain-containing protein n=1 Tax=Haptolina brevifila TaxID=156173 RepID=A0A7S2GVG1_9EUKA|mmetsp:Transcript_48000/g.95793  ORF Transcript_48000/g.95793 Transcript_48000/m.95793 type:complete len:448 (+) Transcript_48000:562-1905(+)
MQVALADEYEVDGYPTVYWFGSSSASKRLFPVRGNHKAAQIVAWVRRQLRPPSVKLRAAADAARVGQKISSGAPQLIVWLPTDRWLLPPLMRAAANVSERVDVSYTFDAQLYTDALRHALANNGGSAQLAAEAAPQPPAGFIVVAHDERVRLMEPLNLQAVATGSGDSEVGVALEAALVELVNASWLPDVLPFTEEYEDILLDGDVPLQLVLIGSPQVLASHVDELRAVARMHRGHVLVVYADATSHDSDGLKEYFGVDADIEEARFFGLDVRKEIRYATDPQLPYMKSDARLAAFDAFLWKLRQGSAPRIITSEVAPIVSNSHSPLHIVVGNTFDEIVLSTTSDVLLHVYASWCGHCKKLEPYFELLAKRYAGVPTVTIAKMDGTINEVPTLDVDGFPTVMLFTASNRQIEAGADVEMNLEGLAQFLESHAELPIDTSQLNIKDEL